MILIFERVLILLVLLHLSVFTPATSFIPLIPPPSFSDNPSTTTSLSSLPLTPQSHPRSNLRRFVLASAFVIPCNRPNPTFADTNLQFETRSKGRVKVKPDVAVEIIRKSRSELIEADVKYVSKGDYVGLRSYLPTTTMCTFENNITSLLQSNALDEESKKEIGTIRRYGVGADVLIMYGGLLASLEPGDDGEDEINGKDVAKYMERTLQAIDEVIAICKSNGL